MRGVYENPIGSGIWWVHYYGAGKRHREKVGRKSDAIKLYQSRKADVAAGRKLPELRNSKVVTLSELIDDVLEFVAHHKDNRSYTSKGEIVRKALGSKPAADLTPQELERWLRTRCKTPATGNRYKAFISLCYREGIRNGKVSVNPARLVRQRKEGTGRLRFLSREDYDRLHRVIAARFPEHLAEFVVSVHTGMRLSEQYSCMWSQVDLERRTIELTKTKNGSARTVHLNVDALRAIESLKRPLQKASDAVFRREGSQGIAGAIRHPILVSTMSGRGKDCELRLALKPAHVLLLVSNGGSINQGDPGTRRPQDNHHVCALQPSVTGTPTLRD